MITEATVADQLEFENWPVEQQELAKRLVGNPAFEEAFEALLEDYNAFRDQLGFKQVRADEFLN